ncbi:hypothetical protein RJ640_016367 [Escallonia rubra]|uniref:t-SNARE coiled-coil homology domain-containing protein n=1 Tax=Escallonia rubra TaxID=112253 RepID=A0AA88RF51_9ASTE|nr:hypothetical protein RJ640_016367 [Escallonia rubra]
MSVIDILFRVDAICKKYENLICVMNVQKSEMVAMETNRATIVAKNAEIRRMKARLMDEVPKLQKLAMKKVKGISSEELAVRNDMVLALPERIQAIPDGTTTAANQIGGWAASASHKKINFDSDGNFGSGCLISYAQDQGLDIISEGLDTLKDLAHDMNEELDRQVPLVDEIDTKVDGATADLKNTNVRLKETVTKIRSSRNFCVDIILLCIILGIATYLYKITFVGDLGLSDSTDDDIIIVTM